MGKLLLHIHLYFNRVILLHPHETPPNMSSIGAVCYSLWKTFLTLFVANLGATRGLWVNSSPVKVKLIIFPLFLPEGTAILPMTSMAVCAWKLSKCQRFIQITLIKPLYFTKKSWSFIAMKRFLANNKFINQTRVYETSVLTASFDVFGLWKMTQVEIQCVLLNYAIIMCFFFN